MKILIPDLPELKTLRDEAGQLLARWRERNGIAAVRILLTEKRAASNAYALVRTRTDAGREYTVEGFWNAPEWPGILSQVLSWLNKDCRLMEVP